MKPTDKIKTLLLSGNEIAAIKVASRFHDTGADTTLFKRAYWEIKNGNKSDAIISRAVEKLRQRFAQELTLWSRR